MTVKELKQAIKDLPEDLVVTVADYSDDSNEDEEGNSFCPFYEAEGAETVVVNKGVTVLSIFRNASN